jgi:hypothetical protein
MKIKNFSICKNGIWFDYKGDVVLYKWPWRRNDGNKFVSLLFEHEFKSLRDLNKCWDDYLRVTS